MVIAILVSVALCPIVMLVFYRIYLHPLAKYPGPLFGRFTDWYNVYHCLKGDRHMDFVRLHHRYGKFVRYGPNRLSINSATALNPIYGTHANTKKAYFYDTMQFYVEIPSTENTTDKVEHARKRRILAQALSDRMLHVYEPGLLKVLETFLRRYELPAEGDASSKVYDLGLDFTLLSFDFMGDFCFGKSFGSLEDPSKAEILHTISEGLRGLNAVGHMPAIAHLKLDKLNPRLLLAMEEYTAYSAELAKECIARSSRQKGSQERPANVFSILLEKSKHDQGETFSLPELESESALLVSAGADTTAKALANTMFQLLNNPDTLTQLTTEIRSNFSAITEIRPGPTLQQCEYLSACIDEAFRLTPPVGGCLQRCVLAGGTVIDGHYIPEGTDVGVPHHAIMRNGEYYDNPWSFEPRRWIKGEGTESKLRTAKAAFCPFGLGPTGCIGKTWALTEMKVTLAQMVFRYDIEMVLTPDEIHLSPMERLQRRERKSVDRFVVGGHGPLVRIRKAS